MREVIFHGDGFALPLLQSAVMPAGFRHGFTTRRGGVSEAPFDTMNLGGKWGDQPERVAENRRRLHAAVGQAPLYFATQVHGIDSAIVVGGAARDAIARTHADALIAPGPGPAVGVYVADCVPILIADTVTGAVAAVHAGWRGTVAGILSATLERLRVEHGTRMSDVRVAIGPSIGPCCFEVGAEVVAAVEVSVAGARGAGAIIEGAPKPHVDLWMLNRMAAEGAGVAPGAIDVAEACTSCDRTRFFSYRRDHGKTGQLACFIAAGEPGRRE
jgi:YfiH family protein